jgi:hypothetical protein
MEKHQVTWGDMQSDKRVTRRNVLKYLVAIGGGVAAAKIYNPFLKDMYDEITGSKPIYPKENDADWTTFRFKREVHETLDNIGRVNKEPGKHDCRPYRDRIVKYNAEKGINPQEISEGQMVYIPRDWKLPGK